MKWFGIKQSRVSVLESLRQFLAGHQRLIGCACTMTYTDKRRQLCRRAVLEVCYRHRFDLRMNRSSNAS